MDGGFCRTTAYAVVFTNQHGHYLAEFFTKTIANTGNGFAQLFVSDDQAWSYKLDAVFDLAWDWFALLLYLQQKEQQIK